MNYVCVEVFAGLLCDEVLVDRSLVGIWTGVYICVCVGVCV